MEGQDSLKMTPYKDIYPAIKAIYGSERKYSIASLIYEQKAIGTAEIARQLGLTQSSVSTILKEMHEAKVVDTKPGVYVPGLWNSEKVILYFFNDYGLKVIKSMQ